MGENEHNYPVVLLVYDLTNGMMRKLARSMGINNIDGLWHTSVNVYGMEYYFGREIMCKAKGSTEFGDILYEIDMGVTHIPKEVFLEYLNEVSKKYNSRTYDIMTNNCNNFSNDTTMFLLSKPIPDYILNLPKIVMQSGILASLFGANLGAPRK